MIALNELSLVLAGHEPVLIDRSDRDSRAAVAMIIDSSGSQSDPNVIFIERAQDPKDPWSGHMALPGGRCETSAESVLDAARRETQEEIGLYLPCDGLLGRLDDLQGRHAGRSQGLVISCLVFGVDKKAVFTLNHEVADIVQVPFSVLLDKGNRTTIEYPAPGSERYPAVRFVPDDSRVIWGLTYRFLRQLVGLFGHCLPES